MGKLPNGVIIMQFWASEGFVDGTFRLGTWLVQPKLNTVSFNGTTARLEPKVMEVLVCLASHPGDPIAKETIIKAVWPDTFVSEDVLTRSISELRRVLQDDARDSHVIQTIPKRGYRLLADVEPLNGANPRNPPATSIETGRFAAHWRQAAWIAIVFALVGGLLIAFKGDKFRARFFGVPAIHSLAVLPLRNLSDDPSQKYFAAGMTEELITDLSQIRALKVISHTSSNLYDDTHKSLPDIARELHVDGVVEGSVVRSANRVRITAQLVYAPEDKNLWAHSYERDVQDALALQGTLANAIAEEIRIQVAPNEQERLQAAKPISVSALDNYLEGNYHLHRMGHGFGEDETRKAQQYFQRAVDEAPSFVPAYIGLAAAHNESLATPALLRQSHQDHEIGKALAEKALQLDPNSPEVHDVLANLACDDWNWSEAEAELRRSIALNPNRSESRDALGYFLIALGHSQEGIKELQHAQELDPNNDHLANFYFYQGNYEESIRLTERDLAREPDDGMAHYSQFQTFALAGRYPEAIDELEQALKLYGFADFVPALDKTFRKSGFKAAMRLHASVLENLQKNEKIYLPGMLAEVYCLLGAKDRAFYWLEDAYRHKYSLGADGTLLWLKGNPFYAPLHADPRFADLVRRVGLPKEENL
jgi:TolB-like protein/DNA-binding winged helix-turn-helix (wHTH) protein